MESPLAPLNKGGTKGGIDQCEVEETSFANLLAGVKKERQQ